jgi:hypothetical protein
MPPDRAGVIVVVTVAMAFFPVKISWLVAGGRDGAVQVARTLRCAIVS